MLKPDKINWSEKTLLLVDDDYTSSLLIKELLCETKIHIIEVSTGCEASTVFQSNKNINIVLLDIKLPGIDGFEVSKQMRKINPAIPIVAYTAFKLHTIANDSEIECFDDVLLKPICIDEMFCIFRKYLHLNQ